jgi:asparagine synthase (glutamine-hydrolysing)
MDLPDDPARTFFLGVRRVPPAHRLVATSDGDRLERYWDADPSRQITYRNDREYADHFLDVFERAMADRLRAPAGPVGIALSGGLDSSAVAAVATKTRRSSLPGDRPELFACSFVFSTLLSCDERSYISETAASLSLDAELIEAERFWPLGDRDAYRPRIENPFLMWESSFREMLSRIGARGGHVLLTGHGGDDLMAGSPLVYADRLVRGDLGVLLPTLRYAMSQGRSAGRILYRYYGQPLVPARIDRRLRRLLRRSPAAIPDWMHPELVQRTQLAERLEDAPPARHPRGAAWQELRSQVARFYPWDRAVHWYDAQAAPFGIEVRHPFLDRRIAEFLLAIPPRQRSEPGVYKPLLRRAMDTLLPERVRQRRDKTWLGAFIDLGFRDKEAKRVESLLQAPLAAELGIVDAFKLRSAFEKHRDRKTESAPGLWYAVTLELWLQEILSAGMSSTSGVPLESDSLRTVA